MSVDDVIRMADRIEAGEIIWPDGPQTEAEWDLTAASWREVAARRGVALARLREENELLRRERDAYAYAEGLANDRLRAVRAAFDAPSATALEAQARPEPPEVGPRVYSLKVCPECRNAVDLKMREDPLRDWACDECKAWVDPATALVMEVKVGATAPGQEGRP